MLVGIVTYSSHPQTSIIMYPDVLQCVNNFWLSDPISRLAGLKWVGKKYFAINGVRSMEPSIIDTNMRYLFRCAEGCVLEFVDIQQVMPDEQHYKTVLQI
jgi:hypothetical protein